MNNQDLDDSVTGASDKKLERKQNKRELQDFKIKGIHQLAVE